MPGKNYVGIEVPNSTSTVVRLRPILESGAFHKVGAPLAMALGRDVSGSPLVADLSRMPHLLIGRDRLREISVHHIAGGVFRNE